MKIKSSKTLVEEALKQIKTINAQEAKKLYDKNLCTLIDLRDIRELHRDGAILNSLHIPRGMLEFWIDPNSEYFKKNMFNFSIENKDKSNEKNKIVLFCAAGMRSALSAKTLQDMGFDNVAHIEGGFASMIENGFQIDKKK